MTEPKWIPGPYAVDPDYRPGMAYNRHIVLDRDHNLRIAFMAHDGEARDAEFKATAQLLATSPKLYAALDRASRALAVAVRAAGGDPAEHEACVEAFAALAEARGDR